MWYKLSAVSEVLKKFDELENAMRTHLGKVDPPLIVDLIYYGGRRRILYILSSFS